MMLTEKNLGISAFLVSYGHIFIHSYMVTYLWHQSLNSNSHIFDIKERKSGILYFIWSHIHGTNARKSKDIYISVHIFMTLKEENMSICC